MFRKILIAAFASFSLLTPLALPAAQAHDVHPHRHHEFRVYFRECGHEPWRSGGAYRYREDAVRAAHRLRERGFETIVR